jgi:hypothetical protein
MEMRISLAGMRQKAATPEGEICTNLEAGETEPNSPDF